MKTINAYDDLIAIQADIIINTCLFKFSENLVKCCTY